jgi:hypothetical protein
VGQGHVTLGFRVFKVKRKTLTSNNFETVRDMATIFSGYVKVDDLYSSFEGQGQFTMTLGVIEVKPIFSIYVYAEKL